MRWQILTEKKVTELFEVEAQSREEALHLFRNRRPSPKKVSGQQEGEILAVLPIP